MPVRFQAMSTEDARALQRGGLDANGQAPWRRISEGDGVPCRHCLGMVRGGQPYLVLAYRPFRTLQAYAEVGPIFLCARECAPGSVEDVLPEFLASAAYIVRGYDQDERIVYGTGQVTPTGEIIAYSDRLLERPEIWSVRKSPSCMSGRPRTIATMSAPSGRPARAGRASCAPRAQVRGSGSLTIG